MIRDIAVRKVLQLAMQSADAPTRVHRFVDVTAVPLRRAPIVEPELVIRVPIRGANPATQIPGHARHTIARRGRIVPQRLGDLTGERRRDPLVGIERENPVVRGDRCGEVLLCSVTGPIPDEHAIRVLSGDGQRVVGAPRINHDELVGPGGGLKRLADTLRFVFSDDRDRELRHSDNLQCTIVNWPL